MIDRKICQMNNDFESTLRRVEFFEIMPEMRTRTEVIILDFNQIPNNLPLYTNTKKFFEICRKNHIDPRLPINRQKFNNEFLNHTGKRYLIGRYAEDRIEMLRGSHIAEEGRTLHLGIDIFSRDLEPVYSPTEGKIIKVDREEGSHGYGNYVIVEHNTNGQHWCSFFGHLSKNLPKLRKISKGEQIAILGDFKYNENGGWSRHLHYQILREPPLPSKTPLGYSSRKDFEVNTIKFPDPRIVIGNIY